MQSKFMSSNADKMYKTPLSERYASQEMLYLFSPYYKYSTWRKLWIALAEAQKHLGLEITEEQIAELKEHVEEIDFESVEKYEKELQHDVMAHIHAYGDLCPKARSILHLGATSCFVTDNTDTIQMQEGLLIIQKKVKGVIRQLADFAKQYADHPCLGYTHFQPAQLTTVGKRACLWIQDLIMDLEEICYRRDRLKFLGVKGATGTQASFLSLFDNDREKVKQLDLLVAKIMGFPKIFKISGQTYSRKQDTQVVNALAGISSSAHKFATDIRLLAGLKEIEEPFGAKQVGSSAMPYKRNPMLSERICSLSRFVIALAQNPEYTHATQWLERSLDDSANRRLCLSETFLATDAVLNLMLQVTKGLVVNSKVIQNRVMEELPFMATENILMECVRKGGDRQALHEKLRVHSQAAGEKVKSEGVQNDLLQRISSDSSFSISEKELEKILNTQDFIGRAPEQVTEFLSTEVDVLTGEEKI
ncbi:MAG: Adenylosuccinate lyase [Chlamydiae bacterium]|nr:Adenylosuccinate lyase [Chlamydiota bacterium]